MPKNENLNLFIQGFGQGYSSESERQRQVLQQQLDRAAEDRRLAVTLAQSGITDPAVYEALRAPAAPVPGPGSAGGAIVDILGKLGGKVAGKLGADPGGRTAGVFDRLGPPEQAPDSGVGADTFGTLASAVQAAKERETKLAVAQQREAYAFTRPRRWIQSVHWQCG